MKYMDGWMDGWGLEAGAGAISRGGRGRRERGGGRREAKPSYLS